MLRDWLNRAICGNFILLEALDDNDDVQNVWHNWDAPESDDED